MKWHTKAIMISMVLLCSASITMGDVNEGLTFTNNTDEPLYVSLAVDEFNGWSVYDVYVETGWCSFADFFAYSPYAVYSACAYGEFTDDFYGCIEGNLNEAFDSIYLDGNGTPYLSTPPRYACDLYIFDRDIGTPDVVIVADEDYHQEAGACFIRSLF